MTPAKGGDLQPGDSVLCGDDRKNGNERAGGARDLHAGTAENRGHEGGDDRRIQPLLRPRPGGDGERHRQRQ